MALEHWPEGEGPFREWLNTNASEVLRATGIRAGHAVLDYGCNRGRFTIPAARIVGPGGRVYALDTNREALDCLRKSAGTEALVSIETVLVSDKREPIPALSRKVDVVLLYDVLQVIDDKVSLLGKLHAVLKDDGVLSVFPMHVGVQEMLRLAQQSGVFVLSDRYGMLLNFRIAH